MGETANTSSDNASKKSFFKGLKSEFKKIIWPDRKTLGKQSIAVVTVSIALGVIIALIDFLLKFGIDFLVK